jgi:hypothetical protein
VRLHGREEPVPDLGRQDPTFLEDLSERTRLVAAPRLEGAQEGRGIDESLSEREEAQEEVPSHVVLAHELILSS